MQKPLNLPAFVVLLCVSACTRPYQQPAPNEPHAVVKVRLAYHDHPGPSLTEKVRLNEFGIELPPDENLRAVPVISAIRVRPERNDWSIATTFYHTYTTSRSESYSYSCGQTTCRSTRQVTQTHTAVDGSCERQMSILPRQGGVYLLQYDYLSHEQCSLNCIEQVPNTDGTFANRPCEQLPAPK
jgi:hypothetical protein